MIGCLIAGGLALFALSRVFRYRRWMHAGGPGFCGHHHRRWHGGGWHHGWHRGGWGDGWGDPRGMEMGFEHGDHQDGDAPFSDGPGAPSFMRGGGRAQRFFVGRILQHVQATPAQEKAIGKAVGEFRDELKKLAGGEGKRSRSEIAEALRAPTFDGIQLGEQFARHDTVLEGARKAMVGLMARIHDALEPEQRERLAAMVERGPRFGWWR